MGNKIVAVPSQKKTSTAEDALAAAAVWNTPSGKGRSPIIPEVARHCPSRDRQQQEMVRTEHPDLREMRTVALETVCLEVAVSDQDQVGGGSHQPGLGQSMQGAGPAKRSDFVQTLQSGEVQQDIMALEAHEALANVARAGVDHRLSEDSPRMEGVSDVVSPPSTCNRLSKALPSFNISFAR